MNYKEVRIFLDIVFDNAESADLKKRAYNLKKLIIGNLDTDKWAKWIWDDIAVIQKEFYGNDGKNKNWDSVLMHSELTRKFESQLSDFIKKDFTRLLCDEKVEIVMDVIAEFAFDNNQFHDVAKDSLRKNLEKAIDRQSCKDQASLKTAHALWEEKLCFLNLNSDEIEGEE